MKSSSLQSKTVRPGLATYSFYASDRHPASASRPARQPRLRRRFMILILLVLLIGGGVWALGGKSTPKPAAAANSTVQKSTPPKTQPTPPAATQNSSAAVAAPATTPCTGNVLAKFIVVSISQRHLWACDQSTVAYDSPVVTGMEAYAADITPTGTYHIYAKETDVTLKGSDTTGSWSDPVSYWMPFLSNQYGTYGFHDATWRSPSDFGNISPDSNDASHGCVELPLATAKWLYDWAPIGTTLTIQN